MIIHRMDNLVAGAIAFGFGLAGITYALVAHRHHGAGFLFAEAFASVFCLYVGVAGVTAAF